MVMLTMDAAEVIRTLTKAPGAEGLRLSAGEASPGADRTLRIEVVGAPAEDDEVVEADGATLFLDATAMQELDDKVLHADVVGEEVHFGLLEQPDEARDEGPPSDAE
jgi:iron-sulfur cluster assembly protein